MFLEWIFATLWIIAQVGLMIALADLFTGTFQWAEDTLGHKKVPFWGKVFVEPNELHHSKPASINDRHWLRSNAETFIMAGTISLIVIALGGFSWQFAVFAVAGGMSQQAHRWAHAPSGRVPRIVRLLQRAKVLQSAQHHWMHHRAPAGSHYCVLTPWLNKPLDRLRYWRMLEAVFVPIFGAPRVPELN